MLTYNVWFDYIEPWSEAIDYFGAVFFSIFTIPIDILLSPLELLAFIIYKIKEE